MVSKATPSTGTPACSSTSTSNLALCPYFGSFGSAKNGRSAPSTISRGSCWPSRWPNGMYQALPGWIATDTPTTSSWIARVPVVSVSKAKAGAAASAATSARRSSSVTTAL